MGKAIVLHTEPVLGVLNEGLGPGLKVRIVKSLGKLGLLLPWGQTLCHSRGCGMIVPSGMGLSLLF